MLTTVWLTTRQTAQHSLSQGEKVQKETKQTAFQTANEPPTSSAVTLTSTLTASCQAVQHSAKET